MSLSKKRKTFNNGRQAKKRRTTKRTFTKLTLGELKFFDLDINDTDVAAGGTIAQVSCNVIAQGTTESTRIGRKLIIHSIGWRFNISLPAIDQGVAGSDMVRVILYLDKQCNGATATVTGILETSDFQSFNNLANKSRFITLMDKQYTVKHHGGAYDGTGTDWAADEINATFFKKVQIPIEYDNSFATGVITTIRTNNIGVLLVGRAGIAGFSSKMRLRFSDG